MCVPFLSSFLLIYLTSHYCLRITYSVLCFRFIRFCVLISFLSCFIIIFFKRLSLYSPQFLAFDVIHLVSSSFCVSQPSSTVLKLGSKHFDDQIFVALFFRHILFLYFYFFHLLFSLFPRCYNFAFISNFLSAFLLHMSFLIPHFSLLPHIFFLPTLPLFSSSPLSSSPLNSFLPYFFILLKLETGNVDKVDMEKRANVMVKDMNLKE